MATKKEAKETKSQQEINVDAADKNLSVKKGALTKANNAVASAEKELEAAKQVQEEAKKAFEEAGRDKQLADHRLHIHEGRLIKFTNSVAGGSISYAMKEEVKLSKEEAALFVKAGMAVYIDAVEEDADLEIG